MCIYILITEACALRSKKTLEEKEEEENSGLRNYRDLPSYRITPSERPIPKIAATYRKSRGLPWQPFPVGVGVVIAASLMRYREYSGASVDRELSDLCCSRSCRPFVVVCASEPPCCRKLVAEAVECHPDPDGLEEFEAHLDFDRSIKWREILADKPLEGQA